MTHFARVENKVCVEVICAEVSFVNEGHVGDPANWKQVSFNTYGNVHYGSDGKPDGGIALRGNFPGIGWPYDEDADKFYPPSGLYPSWVLNKTTCLWDAPAPMPQDGKSYSWNEATLAWVETVAPTP